MAYPRSALFLTVSVIVLTTGVQTAADPQCRMKTDRKARTFEVTVDASGLKENEAVIDGSFVIDYLGDDKSIIAERTYPADVPVTRKEPKTQKLKFEVAKAVDVRGAVFKWTVGVIGAAMGAEGRKRSGQSSITMVQ